MDLARREEEKPREAKNGGGDEESTGKSGKVMMTYIFAGTIRPCTIKGRLILFHVSLFHPDFMSVWFLPL
jgi:hypothetical protein